MRTFGISGLLDPGRIKKRLLYFILLLSFLVAVSCPGLHAESSSKDDNKEFGFNSPNRHQYLNLTPEQEKWLNEHPDISGSEAVWEYEAPSSLEEILSEMEQGLRRL